MFRVLIALSLAANVALAAVLVFKKPAAVPAGVTPQSGASASIGITHDTTENGLAANAAAASDVEPGATAATGVVKWENLPSRDFPALVARLRAAGFPPGAIRAVLSGLLGREYNARRQALTADDADKPFWKVQPYGMRDPKTTAELSELGRQHRNTLRELLGPDADDPNPDAVLWQRRSYGDLPPDKLRRVHEIVTDYNDLMSQTRSQPSLRPEDRERIAFLEKEKRTDLAEVLSATELEELEMRSSNTASELRWRTTGFNPTKEEFQALYRAAVAVKEKLGETTGGTMVRLGPSTTQQQALMVEELKTVLSPERLAEYQISTDPQYMQTAQLITRLQLPGSVTKDVVNIQIETTARSRALRENQDLSPEERNAALAALAQEATTKLSEKLGGARGLDVYRQYGGQWLNSLGNQR